MSFSRPQLLNSDHLIRDFSCGIASLDNWLQKRALVNQVSGASRTFVICLNNKVVGFYALASGAIAVNLALGKFKGNMPNPIPIVILARLAIDSKFQGQGLGRALFKDAAMRVIQAADTIGIRGIIVHAISEEAKGFSVALGFDESSFDSNLLMVTVKDLIGCF